MVRKNLSNLLSVLFQRAASASHFLESRLVIESRLTEKCFLSDFCLQMDVRRSHSRNLSDPATAHAHRSAGSPSKGRGGDKSRHFHHTERKGIYIEFQVLA